MKYQHLNAKHLTTFLIIVTILLLFTASQQTLASECQFRRAFHTFEDLKFNPSTSTYRNEIHPQLETNATLFRRGKDNPAIYELAKEVEVNTEERSMTIKIDTSCGWSDGNKIVANDVLLGFQMLFTPESAEAYIPGRNMLKNATAILNGNLPIEALGIHVIDDSTIKIELDASPDLLISTLSYIAFTPGPSHLDSENLKKWYSDGLVRISSGPFKATKQTDELIELDRNEHYCSGFKSNITNIQLLGLKRTKAHSVLFKQGLIDVAEETTHAELKSLDKINKTERLFYKVNLQEQIVYCLIISNSEFFDSNPSVREAIMLAIDYEKLESIFKYRYGEIPFYPSRSLNFNFPGYSPPTYSPPSQDKPHSERVLMAKKIMKEFGYDDEKPLKVSIALIEKNPNSLAGNAIASMLQLINIDAEIVPKKQGEKGENQAKRQHQLIIGSWGTDYSDPENTLAGMANFVRANEDRDAMHEFKKRIADSNLILNQDERLSTLYNIEEELLATNYYLPFLKVVSPWIISNNLAMGDEFYVIGRNMFKNDC